MALFGKLFSKETCINCGKEVGSLSRKRLSDGIICKECAKQLSPWFDDFKQSSTDQIRRQLELRDQNKQALRQLTFTKAFGEGHVILVDEAQRAFCVVQGVRGRTIRTGEDVLDLNPDVISFDQIVSIDTEQPLIVGHEIKRTVDGEQVSYNPKRYEYPCNVSMSIALDHPYISSMSLTLNNGTINVKTEGERLRNYEVRRNRTAAEATADWLLNRNLDVEHQAETWADNSLEATLKRPFERALSNPVDNFPDYSYGFRCSRENWPYIQEYDRCVQAAESARAVLLQGRE